MKNHILKIGLLLLSFILVFSYSQKAFAEALNKPYVHLSNPSSFIMNEDDLPFLAIDNKGNKTLVVSIDYSKDGTFKEMLNGIDTKTGKIKWSKRKISSHIKVDSDRGITYMYSTRYDKKNTITAIAADGKELWSNSIDNVYNQVDIDNRNGNVFVYDTKSNKKTYLTIFNLKGKIIKEKIIDGQLNDIKGRYWFIYDYTIERTKAIDSETNKMVLEVSSGEPYLLKDGTFLFVDGDYKAKKMKIVAYNSSGHKQWTRYVWGETNPLQIVGPNFLVVGTKSVSLYSSKNKLISSKDIANFRNLQSDDKAVSYEVVTGENKLQLNILNPTNLEVRHSIDYSNNRLFNYYSGYFEYLGNHQYYQDNQETDSIELNYIP